MVSVDVKHHVYLLPTVCQVIQMTPSFAEQRRLFCRVTHTVMVCPAARMTVVVSVSVSTASPSVSKFRMWICHYPVECQAKVQDGMLRVKITIAAYVRLPCLVSTLRGSGWGDGAGEGGGVGGGVGRRRQTVFGGIF